MRRYMKLAYIVLILIFVLFIAQSFMGIDGFTGKANLERAKTVEDAIQKAAIQCYALEGSYPDLNYLVAHYGLVLNESAYYYHYEWIASNILPNISVYKKW